MYVPVKGDEIDAAVALLLSTGPPCPLQRLCKGVYESGARRFSCWLEVLLVRISASGHVFCFRKRREALSRRMTIAKICQEEEKVVKVFQEEWSDVLFGRGGRSSRARRGRTARSRSWSFSRASAPLPCPAFQSAV